MKVFFLPIWALIGAGIAFLFLKSQWWSAFAIQPEKPKGSKWLIVGGAVIRWFIIAIIFVAAGYFSTLALFTVFISYMVSRLLILRKWQKIFNTE